ncbi:hypothetical protein RHMOL_Rhmol12G0048000 [Rhododendron molle]|uniref:Uncharacterized protein n=1 Tax=Rhododendron molle TaxID=49168 RepID=A0ACC0LFK2_RHOML|nr:hypothetical protein RHMOL_Rhmol12G0048000 [Rhododendron molle]
MISAGRSNGSTAHIRGASTPQTECISQSINTNQRNTGEFQDISQNADSSSMTRVTSDKDYFPTQSMNQTVQFVRDKLNKIQSSTQNIETGPSKKPRVDNRRRI